MRWAAHLAHILVFLAVAVILLLQSSIGQKVAGPAPTLRQVDDLVSLGAPDSIVHAEIQNRGLAFTPDPSVLASLRAKGAGPMTLAEITALIPKASGGQVPGGRHWTLVLEVQGQDAINGYADRTIDQLKTLMKDQHLDWASMDRNDPQTVAEAADIQITVNGIAPARRHHFEQMVGAALGDWTLATVGAGMYRLSLRPEAFFRLRESAVDGVVETLRRRVEAFGLEDAEIRQDASEGSRWNVACRLPAVADPARFKQILFAVGVFRLFKVKEGPFPSSDEALRAHNGILPLATRLGHQASGSRQEWYLLESGPVVSMRDLRDARPTPAENGTWVVTCSFRDQGASSLARFEQASPGNRLAIVFDGIVRGVQKVDPRISERFEIRGFEQERAAADFALVLRSGELPARTVALTERADDQ
jgi:preprotein translocase subunit SecD